MMFLLTNWKTILGVIATAALAFLLHAVDIDRIEGQQRQAIADQAESMKKQCDAEKAITEGVSHDYHTKISDLDKQHAAVKRVQPSRCIAVSAAVAAGGGDGAARPAKPAAANGVTSDALYDFAAEAERYRLQLISCQDFITKTWNLVGQGEATKP